MFQFLFTFNFFNSSDHLQPSLWWIQNTTDVKTVSSGSQWNYWIGSKKGNWVINWHWVLCCRILHFLQLHFIHREYNDGDELNWKYEERLDNNNNNKKVKWTEKNKNNKNFVRWERRINIVGSWTKTTHESQRVAHLRMNSSENRKRMCVPCACVVFTVPAAVSIHIMNW